MRGQGHRHRRGHARGGGPLTGHWAGLGLKCRGGVQLAHTGQATCDGGREEGRRQGESPDRGDVRCEGSDVREHMGEPAACLPTSLASKWGEG